jgi:hypothetical protein
MNEFWHSPNVVTDSGERELGPVQAFFRVSILVGHRTCASVGTTETIETDNKEPRDIEGLSGAAQ